MQLQELTDALTAARPDMTGEQQDTADALLAALTPPMEEPKWPGAAVMAKCPSYGGDRLKLHIRRYSPLPGPWECHRCAPTRWDSLRDPRPLTPDEHRKYGIPMPAEAITGELVERCIEASGGFIAPSRVRLILRAAGHPEATA